jgi:hypothetical protein
MGMTGVSVISTVLVLNFHHRGPNKAEVQPSINARSMDTKDPFRCPTGAAFSSCTI